MQEEFLNEMEELLKEDFPKYIDSFKEIPRKAIHLNTSILKDKSFLEDILKEVIPFDHTSYFIDLEKPGLHIGHTLGLFYVQEPSAMMPVLALSDFPKNAKILDLCASPGGKTLHLANLFEDGVIYANEVNKGRGKKLVSNIERLGLKNVVVTQMTSQELKNTFQDYFDIILVDAPCSLEGTFRKDALAISLWSKERVQEMARLQKELLQDVIPMLKKNGQLIYSTCTFSKEEDEEVVQEILSQGQMKLVDGAKILLPYTKSGEISYGEEFSKTRRCYPFIIGEGQFYAVMKKNVGSENGEIQNQLENLSQEEEKIVLEELQQTLINIPFTIKKYHNQIIAVPSSSILLPQLKTLACFVKIGEIYNHRFIFHHQFARSYGNLFKHTCNLKRDDTRLKDYLKVLEIEYDIEDGWGVILVEGYPLGLYKAKNHHLKNHYPKGLRN